ncbi:MAG: T9SS type A sorting domain-containing protein [Gemmatimonadota bacterium]|nr:MAG: T9SS type A sorting domain-containing protein [Gemmatimonadota bacterium]
MSLKMYLTIALGICVTVFTGSLCASTEQPSQDLKAAQIFTGDALSFEAGTHIEVPIVLTTTKSLAGIQISLEYNGDIMTPGEPVPTERTAGMSVAHNITDDKILILLYDVTGKTISPGNDPVLTLPFSIAQNAEGRSELVFREVILADEGANAVPAEVKSTPITFEKALPTEYGLVQNYPNPFNPETVIAYQLPEESHVTLTVYNVLGQEIRRLTDERQSGGFYQIVWDGKNEFGKDVSTGVYFYRLQAGGFKSVKKMMMLK